MHHAVVWGKQLFTLTCPMGLRQVISQRLGKVCEQASNAIQTEIPNSDTKANQKLHKLTVS